MKYTIAICVLFAAWIVLSITNLRCVEEKRVQPRIPSYSWAEVSDIFARQQELDEELRKIQLYRKNQSGIEERLRTERLSLRSAAVMLDAQARDNHPRLHEMLGERYPILSPTERMALLLLEHLESEGCPPEVIHRLCFEMATWSEANPTQFRWPRQLK